MRSTVTKVKSSPRSILGGALGFFNESGYEMEVSTADIARETADVAFEGIVDLFKSVSGIEEDSGKKQMASEGSIEFNKPDVKKQAKANADKVFYESLKEEQQRAQMAKDRIWFEEEISDITTNISTQEKNELLHYQASYKDRSVYQKAELRRKLIEKAREKEKQSRQASEAQTKSRASALQTAFEGGSGSQGSGQANLSAQATG